MLKSTKELLFVVLIGLFSAAARTPVAFDKLHILGAQKRYDELVYRYITKNWQDITVEKKQVLENCLAEFERDHFKPGILLAKSLLILERDLGNEMTNSKSRSEIISMRDDFLNSEDFIKSLYYFILGDLSFNLKKYSQAIQEYLSAKRYVSGIALVNIQYSLAYSYYLEGNEQGQKALDLAFANLTMIEENNLEHWLVINYDLIARIYQQKAEYANAIHFLFKVLEIDTKNNEYEMIVRSLNQIAITKMGLEEFDSAISYLLKATKYFDKKDVSNLYKSIIYINLATSYSDRDLLMAKEFALNAIEVAKEGQLLTQELNANFILADIYIKDNKPLKALKILLDTDKIDQIYWESKFKGWLEDYLAQVYLKLGEYNKVEGHLLKAIEYTKKYDFMQNLAPIYQFASKFYQKTNDIEKSIKYLEEYHELTLKAEQEKNSKILYARENKTLALENRQNDLIVENQRSRILALVVSLVAILIIVVLQFNRNIMIKQKNAELLRKEQKIREETERARILEIDKLNYEIKMRSLVDQMHPHFLFNSLNIIANLMYESIDKADDSITRLSDMYRLMLQGSKSLTWKLADELQLIEDYLELQIVRFEDKFTYIINHQDVDPNQVECPCLMLHTLVENAIKHGVALNLNGGQVAIDISPEAGGYRLKVEDSGSGDSASSDDDGTGTGIKNTLKRLTNLYGSKGKLVTQFDPESSKIEFWISGEKISSFDK